MGIPSAVPFLEVVAYAGYPFVHVCLTSLAGAAFGGCAVGGRHSMHRTFWQRVCSDAARERNLKHTSDDLKLHVAVHAAGRVVWHVLWVYGALCMAVFTVRTIKRVIFHEARQYRECRH
jgi:hypothetical protein